MRVKGNEIMKLLPAQFVWFGFQDFNSQFEIYYHWGKSFEIAFQPVQIYSSNYLLAFKLKRIVSKT